MNRFNQRTSPQGTEFRDWWIDNVACPFCGAPIGSRCWTRRVRDFNGRQYPTPTHNSRKNVAKTLYLLDQVPKDQFRELLDLATS